MPSVDGELERAREICLRLLSVRPRTRAELAQALRRNGISDEAVGKVLDRYSEVGMVDDRAFSLAWVTSRHNARGLARAALAGELRRKGVAPDLVGSAVAQIDDETEQATARALVERKLRARRRAERPEATMRRLVGLLARKGYPQGLAFRVVKEVLTDRLGRDGLPACSDTDEFNFPGEGDQSIDEERA